MLTATDPHRLPARVAVAGVSGVGESTLARRIATQIGAPDTEIDAPDHGAGWVPRPKFLDEIAAFSDGPVWVTECQSRPRLPVIRD